MKLWIAYTLPKFLICTFVKLRTVVITIKNIWIYFFLFKHIFAKIIVDKLLIEHFISLKFINNLEVVVPYCIHLRFDIILYYLRICKISELLLLVLQFGVRQKFRSLPIFYLQRRNTV